MESQNGTEIRLFSICGISVGIHKAFFLVGLIVLWLDGPLSQRLLFLGLLFGSILVHEFAHAMSGFIVGNRPKAIMLSFWGGSTEFQRMIHSDGIGMIVAMAGPIANVALFVCGAIGAMALCKNGSVLSWINYFIYDFLDIEMTKVSLPVGINMWHFGNYIVGIPIEQWESLFWFKMLAGINGMLALFNFAPAYPLDGGRIFRCLAGFVIGRNYAALLTLVVGRTLAVGFTCWCLYYDLYRDHDVFACFLGCYLSWMVWEGCYYEYACTKTFVAAEQGDVEAEYSVGRFYLYGIAVEKNEKTALEWFAKAAEHGYAPGQNVLSLAYMTGECGEKDEAKAFAWAQKSADQNFPAGICTLGNLYAEGIGCERDQAKAFALYSKAGELSDVEGMYHAAISLLFGVGVEQDVEKAECLLEKAFGFDYVPAAVELKLMYEYQLLKTEDGQVPAKYEKLIQSGGQEASSTYAERKAVYESIFNGSQEQIESEGV